MNKGREHGGDWGGKEEGHAEGSTEGGVGCRRNKMVARLRGRGEPALNYGEYSDFSTISIVVIGF